MPYADQQVMHTVRSIIDEAEADRCGVGRRFDRLVGDELTERMRVWSAGAPSTRVARAGVIMTRLRQAARAGDRVEIVAAAVRLGQLVATR
ncbi:hypothetical protein [Williamsia sterculiae]|uniref:Uncharacterized protein n=1 Tax=Williamsia sterculiae TaxID=1344003 RepID=A0A1N7G834_9NOCA|nr:hypothetical protein [Williamsia sterculiae]SIS08735.1 hypothetical protein SAMN05445060_2587 [Williamsia sterculiae]